MNRTDFVSERLRERYCRLMHRSGLTIYVFPKKLTGIYALLATGFGSIDTTFSQNDGAGEITVPDGIAHFLEHKMFENEDGSDSFARFSSLGADANAYTSYNKTAYLFSCTENFEESLEELLEFVTHPHFTQKSVQKEIGIISEEIRMTEDNPWDRGFQLLLEALYHRHPVRKSICGTQESIRAITPEALYACYRAFYDLSQMSLVVCGDVSVERVLSVADRVLPKTANTIDVKRILPNEEPTVRKKSVRDAMQVSKPIFFMGFKDVSFEGDVVSRLRRDAAMTLLGEILFSRSGEFYNSLFENGKITPSFSAGYSIAESFAFYCLSGEADHPEEIFEAVLGAVERVKREGISTEDLERCRRVMYADEVRAYDSTEEIANRLLSFALEGGDIFSYTELIEAITKEELTALLDEVFCKDRLSVSIIDPLSESCK